MIAAHRQLDLMEWQNELNQDALLFFSNEEQDDKPKKRLADPITTPKKGPLGLIKPVKQQHLDSYPKSAQHSSQHFPRTKQKYLNRFPVPDVQRPIEAIESSLGGMSFAELKQHAITVSDWSTHRHNPVLPTLNPLMKYSPIGHHGNHTTESHTHKTSGPMDIFITYSRHTTPRNYQTQSWLYPQLIGSHYIPTRLVQMKGQTTQSVTSVAPHSGPQLEHHAKYPRQHLSPRQGQLLGGMIRPTIAPHSLHALAVHKFKPVTAQTILKGHHLHPRMVNSSTSKR